VHKLLFTSFPTKKCPQTLGMLRNKIENIVLF
jgi:hypothetical protein